ncbi:MAG: hypothetical protein MJY87_01745 [Fibrobacter sp.]|nr:hypothetical protein [Fibrobacter sp.]
MKVVAFVPVKLNNERAPGKNIKCFDDGTALITHFLKTIAKVPEIDEKFVFCSNEAINKYLVPGFSFLRRPESLDTKEATPQDIISTFMHNVEADIYLVCHCTSPFVTADHISLCIKKVMNEGFDSAFTGEKIQRLMWSEGKPLNFDAANVPRTQDLPIYYNEVSAAYVFKKETFEKLHRRIGTNPYVCEVSGVECIDIDYPEDFEIANAIYMNIIKRKEG